jgi:hypothetical protein
MVFLLSVSNLDVDVVYENGVGDVCIDDDQVGEKIGGEEESCCRFPFVFLLFDIQSVSLLKTTTISACFNLL